MSQPSQFPRLNRDQLSPNARLAAFVDVETTGLSPYQDRIVEFAGVLFLFDPDTGQALGIVDEYASLNDPGIPIPRDATKIHGIQKRMVRGHALDVRRIDQMLSAAEFIVAHNATFDFGFITAISTVAREKPWRCSMRQVNWAAEGCERIALQYLLDVHQITPKAAHRALDDVRCALTLLNVPTQTGQPYFHQLVNAEPYGLTYRKAPAGGSRRPARPSYRQPPKPKPRMTLGRALLWGCVIFPLGGFMLLLFLTALLTP